MSFISQLVMAFIVLGAIATLIVAVLAVLHGKREKQVDAIAPRRNR